MVSAKHFLTYLPSEALDAYLEKGWFRMNQSLFITHFLHFENQFYPAVWLRYPLKKGIEDLTERKLKAVRSRFHIRVKTWEYSREQETLFSVYRDQAGIELTPTLLELLMGNGEGNVFNTFQVEMYDHTRLIALGIFDLGENSAAGICNIFHPDYRKYSLGKALIYAKMLFSHQRGLDWFYPGYAVPGKSRFNYKLSIAPGNTEYFCPVSKQWLQHTQHEALPNLLDEMEKGLSVLQSRLNVEGTKCTLVYYRHFDANLLGLGIRDLLTYPIFLLFGYDADKTLWVAGVYDLVSGTYSLLHCHTIFSPGDNHSYHKLVCTDILQVTESPASGLDLQGFLVFLKNFTPQ